MLWQGGPPSPLQVRFDGTDPLFAGSAYGSGPQGFHWGCAGNVSVNIFLNNTQPILPNGQLHWAFNDVTTYKTPGCTTLLSELHSTQGQYLSALAMNATTPAVDLSLVQTSGPGDKPQVLLDDSLGPLVHESAAVTPVTLECGGADRIILSATCLEDLGFECLIVELRINAECSGGPFLYNFERGFAAVRWSCPETARAFHKNFEWSGPTQPSTQTVGSLFGANVPTLRLVPEPGENAGVHLWAGGHSPHYSSGRAICHRAQQGRCCGGSGAESAG